MNKRTFNCLVLKNKISVINKNQQINFGNIELEKQIKIEENHRVSKYKRIMLNSKIKKIPASSKILNESDIYYYGSRNHLLFSSLNSQTSNNQNCILK